MTINVDDLVRRLWDAEADIAEKRDYRGIYVEEELDVDAVGIVREWARDRLDRFREEIDSHRETMEIMRRIRDDRDVLRRKIAAIRPLAEAWADPNVGDEILAILDGGDQPADEEVNA